MPSDLKTTRGQLRVRRRPALTRVSLMMAMKATQAAQRRRKAPPPNAMKEMKSVAVGTQPWDELKMDLVEDDEVRKKLLMEMRMEMLQVRLRGGPWTGHY